MFSIIDKSKDNWCVLDPKDHAYIKCEDGTRKPFVMSEVMCTRGKYEGSKMSEIMMRQGYHAKKELAQGTWN